LSSLARPFRARLMFNQVVTQDNTFAIFKHYGTYEILHITNNTDKSITFSLNGFNTDVRWYKESGAIRLLDEQYITDTSFGRQDKSPNTTIPANSTGIVVSWYVPNGQTINDAAMVAEIDGQTVTSTNTINSQVTLCTGIAYHMYATWDGKELKFGKEEITEDFNQFTGTPEDDEIDSPLIPNCFKRLRWLSFAIINTLLSPFIISLFQDTIQQTVALAVLMPIAGALGGNIGIQTASVVIKGFSTKEFREKQCSKLIKNETLIGIFNGLVIGLLLGVTVLFWFYNLKLSLLLFGTMVFCATWSSFIGVSLPVMFYRFGYDSSLSSGPLITTITDVSGYIVFLGLAHIFLS